MDSYAEGRNKKLEALRQLINEFEKDIEKNPYNKRRVQFLKEAVRILEESAQNTQYELAPVAKGVWLDGMYDDSFCSVCGFSWVWFCDDCKVGTSKAKFCPNCGSSMSEGNNSHPESEEENVFEQFWKRPI